jgi:hypothetical protein
MRGPDVGPKAEKAVAEQYELEKPQGAPGWVDLVNPRTGARYQVKAASTRFRGVPRVCLWEDQHRALEGYQAHAPAWYAFVKLNVIGSVLHIKRRRPSTVGQIVREEGGWNQAGHETRDARQAKVPIERFL